MDQKWSFWTKIDQNVDLADFKSDVFLFLTSRSKIWSIWPSRPDLDPKWTKIDHFDPFLTFFGPFWLYPIPFWPPFSKSPNYGSFASHNYWTFSRRGSASPWGFDQKDLFWGLFVSFGRILDSSYCSFLCVDTTPLLKKRSKEDFFEKWCFRSFFWSKTDSSKGHKIFRFWSFLMDFLFWSKKWLSQKDTTFVSFWLNLSFYMINL
jgi:hypothetical protein